MPTIEEYRCTIVDIAKEKAISGSHYLWGAAGASPDGNEGIINRPGSVNMVSPSLIPNNPAVFTAECSVSGKHICAGRYLKIEGGREANPNDQDLIDYLNELSEIPEDQWQPYYEFFTPRKYGNKIVWGEDCRGKQHFDCVGLVNYCIENAIGSVRPIQFSIEQYASNISGTVAVGLDDEPSPADILIKVVNGIYKHIGILGGYDENGEAFVAEASDTPYGVIINKYSPEKWTYRRRLTGGILHS